MISYDLQARIFHEYINGWKEEKKTKVLDALSENCIIIESHGPTYRGKAIVDNWFDEWHQLGNKVEKWKISSFYSFDDMVFSEWIFAYSGPDLRESFEGMTIAKFKNNKILELREYRMTASPFLWQPSKNVH